MHILVTNDDGVQAPGLLALVLEMRKLGRVTVFAPDRNWSASGHVKTLDRPLRVQRDHAGGRLGRIHVGRHALGLRGAASAGPDRPDRPGGGRH